ncbi:MAG: hypothetical protein U9Q99_01845, partial [Nanoarchaeota archaeon]|nr:hypothetical protein [Nanoarchaeota archaeon]
KDIFEKTDKIMHLWTNCGAEHTENPQVSHILNYLGLTACYLKSEEEAKYFKENWDKTKNSIKSGSDKQDWLNQSHMINSHLEQALKEENVHNPKDNRNLGIKKFYENKFSSLYSQAKKAYDNFQKSQNTMVTATQKHHEEVFSSQESWEEAVRRGDPMAWVD